jgi:CRP-like cAMP-binding protein
VRLHSLFARRGDAGRRAGATPAQLAHALRGVPLFRALPARELVRVWEALWAVELPAGAVVFRRGESGARFFVVQSGAVQLCLGVGPEGVPVRRLGPGDAFGEMALVTGRPRSTDAVTLEESVLWALDGDEFARLLGSSVAFLQALVRDLCQRLALDTALLEELGAPGVPGGVAGLRFGPYRVVEQIGAGGSAAVFGAVHATTGEAAAIKVLPLAWGHDPERVARLEREVAALQRLRHPNVIRLLETGPVAARSGGGCYLAMEWLPNALDRVLRARFPDPLAPAMALRCALGVARGLAATHAAGIVHRDVKPSNILLRADGTPVLTDFGLVTAPPGPAGAPGARLTASHLAVGTADYMAPEQCQGAPVDARSDLYALGVVLYELLAGHVPFAGREPLETLRAHVEEAPPSLPETVPAPARAIVARALQKAPWARFPSAAAMAEALTTALAQLPPSADPV